MIRRFRKKSIVIEAMQYNNHMDSAEFFGWCGRKVTISRDDPIHALEIQTLEGVMKVSLGDWIIKGVAGEFYPCKPDIFEKTYLLVGDGMPFGEALEECKAGKRIARQGWNGKGPYVCLVPDHIFKQDELKQIPALQNEEREITFWGCLCIMTTSGKVQLGWLATQSDMQAVDWEVV
ncbi:MAG: DUF2829 domain-containing protein [Treponema sp.]|jgi:hypothetical protein|nr:DUF2829 domain-containing protein [Treponema sp.]